LNLSCCSCWYNSILDKIANLRLGVCRSRNGTVRCERIFPNTFNLSAATVHDITIYNASNTFSNNTEQHQQSTGTASTNHTPVRHLSAAVGTLLIISVLFSFVSIPLSFLLPSAFRGTPLHFLLFDACLQVSAIIMMFVIIKTEFGIGHTAGTEGLRLPIRFGLGFWFPVCAFACRLAHIFISILYRGWCQPRLQYELAWITTTGPSGQSQTVLRSVPVERDDGTLLYR
jgi:hypothetical protein